jgi:hypothetical protein
MSKKQKIIIGISIAVFIVLLIIAGFIYEYYKKKNEDTTARSEQAKESVISQTTNQIGGEIIEDGFNITYESGENRFIITVTKEPFDEYKKRGEEYLKNKGIDLCKINYLVLAGHGVTAPDNVGSGSCEATKLGP